MISNHEILDKLVNLLQEKIKLDLTEIGPESLIREDIGLNSLTVFELVLEIEHIFKIEFVEEDLLDIHTVGDVIAAIKRHLPE